MFQKLPNTLDFAIGGSRKAFKFLSRAFASVSLLLLMHLALLSKPLML